MPEAILTILKFCFLALLYLFLFRVIRVVYLEMGGRGRLAGRASDRPTVSTAPRPRSRRARGPLQVKVVAPFQGKGRTWEIGEELTVGRAAGCQISLADDTYVSQMHARLFVRDGELYVEDLGSTNGTYLNRKKLTCEMPVRRGDRIQVGKTVLELTR